jgi:hypothetical protein
MMRSAGEVVRYLGWPGQALGYRVGAEVVSAWIAARRRAGVQLATAHADLLRLGSIPLSVLATMGSRNLSKGPYRRLATAEAKRYTPVKRPTAGGTMKQPAVASEAKPAPAPTPQVEPLFVTCASRAPKKDCP